MLASPPSHLLCMYFPTKKLYETADQASCALRDVAVSYMKGGVYDDRLRVFSCHDHWHLGRIKIERASA